MTTMPAEMKRGFVDTPDGQIHYWIGGSGDPLLLLHQTPRSAWEFVRMLPILIQHRRVVAIDTIGYGDSDKPPREYSIEDYAKSTVAVLDGLGIEKTSIAGFHTGAYIGTEVAAAYPNRVDKLILGGAFNMDAEERERQAGKWPNFESKEDGSHLAREWKTSLLLGDMDLAPPAHTGHPQDRQDDGVRLVGGDHLSSGRAAPADSVSDASDLGRQGSRTHRDAWLEGYRGQGQGRTGDP